MEMQQLLVLFPSSLIPTAHHRIFKIIVFKDILSRENNENFSDVALCFADQIDSDEKREHFVANSGRLSRLSRPPLHDVLIGKKAGEGCYG